MYLLSSADSLPLPNWRRDWRTCSVSSDPADVFKSSCRCMVFDCWIVWKRWPSIDDLTFILTTWDTEPFRKTAAIFQIGMANDNVFSLNRYLFRMVYVNVWFKAWYSECSTFLLHLKPRKDSVPGAQVSLQLTYMWHVYSAAQRVGI